jgi:hypothetical protein
MLAGTADTDGIGAIKLEAPATTSDTADARRSFRHT